MRTLLTTGPHPGAAPGRRLTRATVCGSGISDSTVSRLTMRTAGLVVTAASRVNNPSARTRSPATRPNTLTPRLPEAWRARFCFASYGAFLLCFSIFRKTCVVDEHQTPNICREALLGVSGTLGTHTKCYTSFKKKKEREKIVLYSYL